MDVGAAVNKSHLETPSIPTTDSYVQSSLFAKSLGCSPKV